MSWTYGAFQNMRGLKVVLDESDENKAIDKPSFPQEIETLLLSRNSILLIISENKCILEMLLFS